MKILLLSITWLLSAQIFSLTVHLPEHLDLRLSGEPSETVGELKKQIVSLKNRIPGLQKYIIKNLIVYQGGKVLDKKDEIGDGPIFFYSKERIANNKGFFELLINVFKADSLDKKKDLIKKAHANRSFTHGQLTLLDEVYELGYDDKVADFENKLVKVLENLNDDPESLFSLARATVLLPSKFAHIIDEIVKLKL